MLFLPFYFFTFKSFFTFIFFQLGKFFFPVREVILDVFLNHNAKLRHPELAVGTYGYIGVFKGTFSFKKDSSFAIFSPHALKGQKLLAQGKRTQAARPERAEALSPGQRPGLSCSQTCRPVRAKALKLLTIYKAFALTGRIADCYYTQGDALG